MLTWVISKDAFSTGLKRIWQCHLLSLTAEARGPREGPLLLQDPQPASVHMDPQVCDPPASGSLRREVLTQGQFCALTPGNVGNTQGQSGLSRPPGGCCWQPVGGGQGCTRDSPTTENHPTPASLVPRRRRLLWDGPPCEGVASAIRPVSILGCSGNQSASRNLWKKARVGCMSLS